MQSVVLLVLIFLFVGLSEQEGHVSPDNSIGRYLADTMASVPRISSDAFDNLFNDSVQVHFKVDFTLIIVSLVETVLVG